MPRDILFDHGNARFSYRISALIVQNGRALLQCPVGTQDYAFIGGHTAFGETSAETLRREIREELHVDAAIGRLIAVGEVFIDWGRCSDGSPRHCHQIGLYFLADVDAAHLPDGDSFFGFDNNHINEKGFSVIASHAVENLSRVLTQGLPPVLEEENIKTLMAENKPV